MFLLQGKLINIFETPKGKTKDGENYGGDDRIQVMHETMLINGGKRVDLVDLTVSDIAPYKDKINATVSIPVTLSVWQGKLIVKAS